MPSASILLAFIVSLLLHGAVLWTGNRPPATSVTTPVPLTAILLPPVESDSLLKNTLVEKDAPPPKSTKRITGIAKIRQAQRKLSPHLYYPQEAVDRGWEGEVRLLLMLDATGIILNVEIAASSGHPLLDRAAVRAVQSMQRLPNTGVREMILPVKFQLQ